jgi:hypothetical protein
VDRRHPERVDPEPGKVIEACLDAAQVPDPVTVGVLKRAGVDLVDDAVLEQRRDPIP